VFIRTEKGELFKWGRFLVDLSNKPKNPRSKKDKKKLENITIPVYMKFPAGQQDMMFKEVITGCNHAAGFANDNKLFVWGFNSIQNRMGCEDVKEATRAQL
jgi:hypothetical protein